MSEVLDSKGRVVRALKLPADSSTVAGSFASDGRHGIVVLRGNELTVDGEPESIWAIVEVCLFFFRLCS
jgi:hypothetical protein